MRGRNMNWVALGGKRPMARPGFGGIALGAGCALAPGLFWPSERCGAQHISLQPVRNGARADGRWWIIDSHDDRAVRESESRDVEATR